MRSRIPAALFALAMLLGIVTAAPTTVSALDGPPPIVSEVMFHPASAEDDWEWIELYNPGAEAIDLAGWVVDDINSVAVAAPNIAAGTIPAGGSAVLYNADDLTSADFEAAWGTGLNLVAVTGWSAMALNNGGDTIGLWEDVASYTGDQATHANALVSVAYNGSIDDGAASVHLRDLADAASWTLSTDGGGTPVGTGFIAAAAGGNSGSDVGSPAAGITPPSSAELFFTQYVEGSGFNKAIEIANLGSGAISLDGYALELYSNGSPTVSTVTDLTGLGSVAANEVFVLHNSSASAEIIAVGDASAGAVNWNGDDAVVLRNPDGDVVDSIGQVGVDPGSAWSANGVSTQNNTMCRNDDVTAGDTDPSDAFDPSVEWTALGNDNIDGLGAIGCGPVDPPGTEVKIHEVQGAGAEAALLDQTVTVQAVITSLFEDNDALDGFFIQEEDADVDADPATSEGLFVFCRLGAGCPTGLAVGDLVTVTGQVTEFFAMSQISTTNGSIVVDSSGNPLPAPISVDLPASGPTDAEGTFESLEGMVVNFTDTLVVSEYFELARYGQLVLTADARPEQFTDANAPDVAGYNAFQADLASRRIILDDNNNDQNDATSGPADNEIYPWPDGGLSTTNRFRGGDTITGLTGVLHWSFAGQTGTDAWRVRRTDADYALTPANPRQATPEPVGGTLSVASYNVLNYFTTIDAGSATCGPSNLGCRGAHSVAELDRQRDKIVAAMTVLDADVLGLIEIENDSGASVADLVAGLNASLGAGTYDYVDTGTIGGDAIKVALIYKPATVSAVGDFAVLDSSVDPAFIDTKNRPVLIQTFEEAASGERFTVAVNHLKSKGSACDDVGDPDAGDGQANCSGTRTAAATALADYLATDPTGSGDPDFLIIGDLNAYAMEDPITALTGAGYTDLVRQFGGDEAYSFVFDGQLGYLDHALANDSLQPQVTGVTSWHINADEVNVLDYNDAVQDGNEAPFERESTNGDLYAPDPFRSSDHDPILIGLELAPPGPAVPTCNGLPATIVGTDGRDVLFGTPGDDVIVALGGNDLIISRQGDDVVCAGDGRDSVWSGNGNDVLFGEGGNDRLFGQNDEDVISGGAGADVVFGASGNDQVSGDDGDDIVAGGPNDDSLDGGAGTDRLFGGFGTDTCSSGEQLSSCEL